jgi:signal transduction histidine kinase
LPVNATESDAHARLEKRYARERHARAEAEAIAERVTGELYSTVQELKTVNVELDRTNRDLQASNQTMKDFVAIASHDLRGPVSAILGFASTMLQQWDSFEDSEKQDYLTIIEHRSKYLTRMLDSLLTVSRIEAGAIEVHRETIDVAAAIQEALEEFADREHQVEIRCPDSLKCLADPDHLHRILVNYISNAFKYGGPPIEVVASDNGEWVELAVRDGGNGIPREFAPRLFHKFARAETDETRTEKGAGLGLSIVNGLARANNGEAWYETNVPRGSTFGVRLPKEEAASR